MDQGLSIFYCCIVYLGSMVYDRISAFIAT